MVKVGWTNTYEVPLDLKWTEGLIPPAVAAPLVNIASDNRDNYETFIYINKYAHISTNVCRLPGFDVSLDHVPHRVIVDRESQLLTGRRVLVQILEYRR